MNEGLSIVQKLYLLCDSLRVIYYSISTINDNPAPAAEKRRSFARSVSDEEAAAFLKKRSLDFEYVEEGSAEGLDGPI